MEVSFSAPQAGVAQSRGVPSATWEYLLVFVTYSEYKAVYLPERPGIVTPLAPVIEVMTPWADTDATRAARVHAYFILIVWKERFFSEERKVIKD